VKTALKQKLTQLDIDRQAKQLTEKTASWFGTEPHRIYYPADNSVLNSNDTFKKKPKFSPEEIKAIDRLLDSCRELGFDIKRRTVKLEDITVGAKKIRYIYLANIKPCIDLQYDGVLTCIIHMTEEDVTLKISALIQGQTPSFISKTILELIYSLKGNTINTLNNKVLKWLVQGK
jgi:hypothetical protein